MADPYTSPTLSGYNANPPPDTGRAGGATNIVTWANHITKIGDPLKTYITAINTNVATAFALMVGGAGVREIDISTGNQSVLSSDQGKLVMVTTGGANQVVLPDPASVGVPFVTMVANSTSTAATVSTAAGTINGLSTITLQQHESAMLFSDGTDWWLGSSVPTLTNPLPRGYIDGFQLTNGPVDTEHDIQIGSGAARANGDTADIKLSSAIIKRIDDVWSVGTNLGGLDNGSVQADTWYALHAIKRPDTGVCDVLFSSSGSSPSMPTNYTLRRLIGWVRTDGSANIVQFVQFPGGEIRLKAPGDPNLDVNETVGTTQETHTITAPPNTLAIINVGVIGDDTAAVLFIRPTDVNNVAASISASPLASAGVATHVTTGVVDISRHFVEHRTWVDGDRQIALRATGNVTVRIAPLGWFDPRGSQ